MASLRPEPKSRGRLGDAAQSKHSGAYMETSTEELSSSLSRRARKEAESRMAAQGPSQPKPSNKIPQTSSRRLSIPIPPQRPSLGKQTPLWGSSGGNSTAKTSSKMSRPPASSSQNTSKPSRNVLRRKQPAVAPTVSHVRSESHGASFRTDSSSSVARSQASLDLPRRPQLDRENTQSSSVIELAEKVEHPSTNAQAVTIYPELDRYREIRPPAASGGHYFEVPYPIATDFPPPTPLFSATSSQMSAISGSPSTRCSESPGPSSYSRDTTPTSMSSQSPGAVAPIRFPVSRSRQNSPANARPPVTRRRGGSLSNEIDVAGPESQGLAAVRESINSSSSNSTVRDGKSRDKKRNQLMAPNPLPRKSSQKFVGRDEDESPTRPSREPALPVMMAVATPAVSAPAQADLTVLPARHNPEISMSRATPPARPSRDGTPDLHSQLGVPSPIIHSNLSSTSLSEGRDHNTVGAPSSLSRSATPLSQPNRQQQLSRPTLGREPTPVPRFGTHVQTPQIIKPDSRKTTRTPSPSVSSALKSRFPLFGRRNKTAPEVPTIETKDRPNRKCPAAGTGHEGYGRLGSTRARRSSVTNVLRAIPGTMSSQSQESLSSAQSGDAFLQERMSPVVIAGGEIIENRNASSEFSRTNSNQSLALPRPGIGSINSSQASLSSQEPRNTLWPSAIPRGSAQAPSCGHRRQHSDSSDSDGLIMKSTLALRRSSHRLQTADQTPHNVPKPINIRSGAPSPSINSHDTTIMSDDSHYDTRPQAIRGRSQSGTAVAKRLVKRAKSPRKWNLFGRLHNQSVAVQKQPEAPKVAVAVKPVQQKPVAFYTVLDSEQEDNGENVEDVLREAQVVRGPSPSPRVPNWGERRVSIARNQSQGSVKQIPEVKKREMTQVSGKIPPIAPVPKTTSIPRQPIRLQQSSMAPKPPLSRPSRLPQVGRIPQVISARPEQMSSKSFSRPFHRTSMQLSSSQVNLVNDEHIARETSPLKVPTPIRDLVDEGSPTLTNGLTNSPSKFGTTEEFASLSSEKQHEFLRFSPPRKDSQGTSTTGSSCSGPLAFSDATAVIPDAYAPLAEDEVWDEYDDLLGMEGLKVPPSAGSSQGKPFHLEMWGKQLAKERGRSPTVEVDLESYTDCETEFDADTQVGLAPPVSSTHSSGLTTKINAVLEAAGSAASPLSVGDFVDYGDRNNSTDVSQSQILRASPSSQKGRNVRESAASGSSQGSDDNSPLSQVNIRVGSMTVSKWLTFGHVLFSPVRDELVPVVGSLKRHSILVVDGLGNDDWSFYAAETYPAATFFNLSPRRQMSSENQNASSFPLSPPNHHQIQYNSHIDKFPFGPQSFTSVVYRFPAAAPESHYRNVVAEARRVLKPGGYLELSILDVDLNNMGYHGRRAVRRLKEQIHTRAPDTSLGSSADLILRLLGRKGFTDIKTCRVGVPVGDVVAPSSKEGIVPPRTRMNGLVKGNNRSKRDTRSLAEMITDTSPVADENITKMVAKVGRWWYNKCYESAGLDVESSKTMWNDRALLRECEEWKTSLKLMVCHAKIPDGLGRVASI